LKEVVYGCILWKKVRNKVRNCFLQSCIPADEFKRAEKKRKRSQKTEESGTHEIKIASYSMGRLANVSSNMRKAILK
jgi:hypothetical protein